MKKIYILVALCCGILATGCQKDEGGEVVVTPAEYTILLYGCGGGDLDPELVGNLDQAKLYGSTDKVKMTAQINYSKDLQADPKTRGTQRFLVRKNGVDHFTATDTPIALNDPKNIAEFIQWSKTIAPANNYILVLWNHGGGWDPDSDPKTRGVAFDDNNDNKAISLNELVAGVRLSDTHLKMIYYDACLMLMLENLCDISSIADYAMGAAHVTPGQGGEYTELLKELNSPSSFTEAMTRYTTATMKTWEPIDRNLDLSLTDLRKLTPVTDILRQVSQELVTTYPQHKDAYNLAATKSYRVDTDGLPFYDVVDYVSTVASESKNSQLSAYASELRKAAQEAIVCSQRSAVLGKQEIYWAITLVNKTVWTTTSYTNGSYQATAYNQATNWSSWLGINESPMPPAYNPDTDPDPHM